MKRIVFLDYVRVFACFLVMVVHASENFYGAEGSTDMVGPQSYLANEAYRSENCHHIKQASDHKKPHPDSIHGYGKGTDSVP